MHYRICNIVIKSEFPFPELEATNSRENLCEFHLHPNSEFRNDVSWYHRWTSADGSTWLKIGRSRTHYVLRFVDVADFTILTSGLRTDCYNSHDVPLVTIRHLFLNQVIPLLISKLGCIVLHASAVVTEKGAIAFIGETGQGKSTLAASFGREGFPILTDDSLLIEESGTSFIAMPSYPVIRLWPDAANSLMPETEHSSEVAHYTEKQKFFEGSSLSFCRKPIPIVRVFFLEACSNGEIKIEPVSPRDAFIEFVKFTYRLDLEDRNRLTSDFEAFTRIASQPHFFQRLQFPKEYNSLLAVQKSVLDCLVESSSSK